MHQNLKNTINYNNANNANNASNNTNDNLLLSFDIMDSDQAMMESDELEPSLNVSGAGCLDGAVMVLVMLLVVYWCCGGVNGDFWYCVDVVMVVGMPKWWLCDCVKDCYSEKSYFQLL